MRDAFDPGKMRAHDQHTEPSPELNQLTHVLFGAAIEVHRVLGPGYLEAVYEEALCIELQLRAIPFERQVRFSLEYKGHHIGENRIDLLVCGELVLELKAVETHNALCECQLLSYLKATHKKLGLVINFNVPLLKNGVKRVINS